MNDILQAYWGDFCSSQPDRSLPAKPDDIFAFGNTPEMADRLGALVLSGVKTATTSALWAYGQGETLPQKGHLSLVLRGDGGPLCIIETTEVRQLPFAEVDAAFAYDEGAGDRTLTYWREAHRAFFSKTLPNVGRAFDEAMPVLCERFRLVYPR